MKKISDTILDAIGGTPMVRINRITRGLVKGTVLVKLETFNPGNSIKDRMAVKMIEDAERAGLLKPGGTIIEGTSGNTGMGLAIAAVVKGYKCVFTTTDKQSKEKVDALKAFGAEVIVCPTNVDPEDPRYRGRIAYAGADRSGSAFTQLATMIHIFGNDRGWALFERILPNLIITGSSGQVIQGVASGEYAIGMTLD